MTNYQHSGDRERRERAIDAVLDYLSGADTSEIDAKRETDRSSQPQESAPLPKVIARVDFSRMEPATVGANRGGMAPLGDYVGGRLHGQITMPGFHDLFRDESGRDLDGRPVAPSPYYRLYRDGVCLRYVHSSLIPDNADDPPAAG